VWIGKDVRGSFHDQFELIYVLEQMRDCDDMTYSEVVWFGTDEKQCSHYLIFTSMRIVHDGAGRCNDEYEVQCGLEQMI
jgi:hypothetical protein